MLTKTIIIAFIASTICKANPLELWISSFQDQVYYEKMADFFAKKSKDFKLEVKAYGFREMPDKLGVALRTGEGIPDMVQLDETFFGVFLNGPSPFLDLTDLAKKSKLDKTLHPRRLEVFTYKNQLLGLPQSLSAMVLYYRKDLFEEFKIKTEDLKTWKDVAEIGEELQESQGQRFLALDGTLFDVLLRQRGTDLFDNKGKFLPDEKVAVEVLQEFAEMSHCLLYTSPSPRD